MTQEDKQLLLQDLCARLPYGVKFVFANSNIYTIKGINLGVTNEGYWEYFVDAKGIEPIEIEYVKPYLRPMSSMTEEEKKNYHKQVDIDLERTAKSIKERFESDTYNPENQFTVQYCHIDWLNAHHFDYRGLIEKGLALEAPEGMYKEE